MRTNVLILRLFFFLPMRRIFLFFDWFSTDARSNVSNDNELADSLFSCFPSKNKMESTELMDYYCTYCFEVNRILLITSTITYGLGKWKEKLVALIYYSTTAIARKWKIYFQHQMKFSWWKESHDYLSEINLHE